MILFKRKWHMTKGAMLRWSSGTYDTDRARLPFDLCLYTLLSTLEISDDAGSYCFGEKF